MAVSRRDGLALLAFVAVVAVVAVAASLATVSAASNYATLRGQSWAPPGWVFGPVWTLLYACIAVAGWLAWRSGAKVRSVEMAAFGAQLVLNGIWSPLFFALQWRGVALVCILVLDGAVAATLHLFWKRQRAAALLMVPYFLWVLFATVLNYAYWSMNR
ncbi:MAG: TspO/MBR family protein [Thermoplasmatota archaeon]